MYLGQASLASFLVGHWNTFGHLDGVFIWTAIGPDHCLYILLDSYHRDPGIFADHSSSWCTEDKGPHRTCSWLQEGFGKCWKGLSLNIAVLGPRCWFKGLCMYVTIFLADCSGLYSKHSNSSISWCGGNIFQSIQNGVKETVHVSMFTFIQYMTFLNICG